MILLIDNYDSFTYNLYQYIEELGEDVLVKRNDEITLEEIKKLNPSGIILSPGPGKPENSGVCIPIIQNLHASVPILGVCLGHQAIGTVFGATIEIAGKVMHGKTSLIKHSGGGLFDYLPQPLEVMRYHSLVIKKGTLPPPLETVAMAMDDGEIMAIKHMKHPLFGVQFHPESIGTKTGKKIIQNFINEMRKENNRETISTKAI
ncbi:aminodeoxychorismate/anthranilate synthase component II (plasmid) [Cytobacillus spongiae]|uniref:anthranilate synthase component II n=1 Tax=Cytobacillus spongiae TaxID=2901381 RepID=UPI00145EAA5A|nr:aminodeoxychorismate/anthranilate synthase component II [Cytobacillus spongiae]MCA1062984.1 aminodeoxychorismate/anthranilate synthase component II [Rossellomorea aquimaris]NMH70317.1 aminodeoxychorismate/anthranilate synthase component II [Bacillus sp. RO3]UII58585.1 aminodeoxychorismate/anthranilate synthase component II [Cytobacillus spongiae]WJV28393.1 aminodeoxychorismate/anthranilate synthase component II [Rossellomorea sp. AcN35-11]